MKDILVQLNDNPSSRLWAAMKLMQRFSAYITALHVKRSVPHEYYSAGVNPDLLREYVNKEDTKAEYSAKQLQAFFGEDNEKVSYVESTGEPDYQLLKYASTSDIVIMEKPDTGQHYDQRVAVPANLALGCGRPVMIVPNELQQESLGDNVLIAWNGTREATRALHDAMPILKEAKSVMVAAFNTTKYSEQTNRCEALENHLTRHGVTFKLINSAAEESEVGARLLKLTKQSNADMIVMGAYGHSRIREYILGGVSRTMIRDTTVPLFLSH